MGNWFAIDGLRGEMMVDVDRIEIAADAGKVDDVGLGHSAARRLPFLTDFQIIKI